MSHNASVDTEPQWIIAPDGYIPNSVFRSLMWKEKELSQPDIWNDDFFSCHHQLFESTADEQEDETTDVFWFIDNMEEEEEEVEMVNWQKSKKENKKNEKKVEKINERENERKVKEDERKVKKYERKVKEDEKNVEEIEEKITVVERRTEQKTVTKDITEKKSPVKRPESPERLDVLPLRPELDSRDSLKNIRSFLSAPNESGQKPLRKKEDSIQPSDTITPPHQCLYTPVKHETPSKEPLKLPVKHEVFSAVITETDPYVEEPPPPQAPPQSPEDPQPVLEPFLFRDEMTLDKHDDIQDRPQLALNLKVMALYAKYKVFSRSSSQRGKVSARGGGRLPLFSFQPDPRQVTLRDGLYRSWSTAQVASGGLSEPNPAQIPGDVTDRCNELMPEWRRNLYKLISQKGSRFHQPSPLPAADCPGKSSGANQPPGTIKNLRSGLAAAHQRVVQNIRMRDTAEPAPRYPYHIAPVASQCSFYTAQLRGKTQYGRLEFQWMRGSEEKKDADNHQ